MTRDIWTVAWKEWREIFSTRGRWGGGRFNFLLTICALGVVVPLQVGQAWVRSPVMLIYWAWVPFLMLSHVMADSIAGERERHTLETLLASRLPDHAILLGKMAAGVAYALAVTAGSLIAGLATVNVATPHVGFVMYPWRTVAGSMVMTLLGSILVAGLGVLLSLRAATVRQASQVMGLAVVALVFGPAVLIRAFLRHQASAPTLPTAELGALLAIAGLAALVLVDVGVVAAALLRFRRSRMLGG